MCVDLCLTEFRFQIYERVGCCLLMKGFHYVVIATVITNDVGGEVSVTPGNTQQVRSEDRKPTPFSRSVRLGEEVLSNN